jgi:hypothetical protein
MGKVRKLVLVPIELEPKIYSVTPNCVPAKEYTCEPDKQLERSANKIPGQRRKKKKQPAKTPKQIPCNWQSR